MNSIAKLIKSKMISFVEVLITNYKKIGLNENETIILSKLFYQLDSGNKILSVDTIAKEMTLDKEDITKVIIHMCETGYINLVMNENGEEFNLDGVIEKLGIAINNENDDAIIDDRNKRFEKIVSYLETTLGRTLNSRDFDVVNDWVDGNYEFEDIKAGVIQGIKAGKTALKYIDTIIVNNQKNKSRMAEQEPNSELGELLKDIYVKR